MDAHSKSNNKFLKQWNRDANENESRVFCALGVNIRGDLQAYLVEDVSIYTLPKALREAADIIEQGNIKKNGLIISH